MSLEILNQLENRIQHTVNTITTLQQEIATLKQGNQELEQLINDSSDEMKALRDENEKLKQDQQIWQQRIQTLLSKIGEITQ
ncbi:MULTISPECIES: cell division protein ZapB [unclassified Gilliamella]|uniref:cell division protein ZapB n=1 Tax=unclassified Gilliamella TaxID=2685620 RepID=UPI00226A4FA7|nr:MULTISPECIES: cell division protein ZapB [unclassified Gilliamella]MCX8642366.1 cell division protein ZapB [Gilliamella sp. B3835]MCX8707764.1 cell division protein ZapB [Gilliamella sp. B3783]MCX8709337.1 cell division protein ZapB [Gilliamella sp. B3780]MCX8711622.1 cell division protein ZapB [Gilliamella sp. B3468]MCX8715223.1 cell division protein ZapB [Gilliamella sp. B3781]